MEPGGTPLFCAGKVSILGTLRLYFMYNSAKVGKCYIVNLITYSTCGCGYVIPKTITDEF